MKLLIMSLIAMSFAFGVSALPEYASAAGDDSYKVAQMDDDDMGKKKKKKKKRKKRRRKKSKKSFGRNYGMAGCGLGSVVFGKEGSQVLASTTNDTSYNNMFGITSGTSNCMDGGMSEVAEQMDRFIDVNKVTLASDIARGQGEALANLGNIMGCNVSASLGSALQSQFESIYPNERVQANDVTDSVINVIINDESLSTSCSNIAI